MKITVCQGTGCRMGGADFIYEDLQQLLRKHRLEASVTLGRHGCTGMCRKGVCVKVEEEKFALTPADTQAFFADEVLRRL